MSKPVSCLAIVFDLLSCLSHIASYISEIDTLIVVVPIEDFDSDEPVSCSSTSIVVF